MFYIGMLFFSLAIASGLWGFAGVGVEVDLVARLIFYTSLLAASFAFATCLLRTAARARSDASNEDEPRDAAVDESSGARTSVLRCAEESDVPGPRSKPVVRSSWRSPPGAGESWVGAGPVQVSESASRAGSIGQEV